MSAHNRKFSRLDAVQERISRCFRRLTSTARECFRIKCHVILKNEKPFLLNKEAMVLQNSLNCAPPVNFDNSACFVLRSSAKIQVDRGHALMEKVESPPRMADDPFTQPKYYVFRSSNTCPVMYEMVRVGRMGKFPN